MDKLLLERDNLIKTDVIQLIGMTGCTNCEEKLIFLLDDPDWRVRFFAIDTLDELNYGNILTLLRHIIQEDKNENVKAKAIMIIGKRGNAKDIFFLQALAKENEYSQDKKLSKAIEVAISKLQLDHGK